MTDAKTARYEAIGFCVNLLVYTTTHIEAKNEYVLALWWHGLETIADLLGPVSRRREFLETSFAYEKVEE